MTALITRLPKTFSTIPQSDFSKLYYRVYWSEDSKIRYGNDSTALLNDLFPVNKRSIYEAYLGFIYYQVNLYDKQLILQDYQGYLANRGHIFYRYFYINKPLTKAKLPRTKISLDNLDLLIRCYQDDYKTLFYCANAALAMSSLHARMFVDSYQEYFNYAWKYLIYSSLFIM